jgi:hypothetical protein
MSAKVSTYIGYLLAVILIVVLAWVIRMQIKEQLLQDDPILYTLKEMLRPITYNGQSIADGLKLYKGDKSYTINKNQTFMCLYDKQGEYYRLNDLLHVLIHERSHSLNKKDIGHTEEFYRIFDELLKQASELGIYNPALQVDPNYCE